jgi:hypothetical protein
MTRKFLFISLAGIIASLILFPAFSTVSQPPVIPVVDPNQYNTNSLEKHSILNATIHIILYPKRNHETGEDSIQFQQNDSTGGYLIERARGIGTVVTREEHVLIITHDHWEWMSDDLDRVELRDANNELLLEMSGEAFRNIIRYRDGGTMILEAPGLLLSAGIVPASLSTGEAIVPGSIVQLAYRPVEDRQHMDVLVALVESINDREGRPILNLRSLDGQSVIKGDSGGGVWFNGQLAGNLWRAVTVETTLQETRIWGSREITVTTADSFIAARFPLDAQALENMIGTSVASEIAAEY